MGLTQVSKDGVKNDAIDASKLPANSVGASELADNAVDTNAIADQAVALSKLPHGDGNSNGKFLRANNGADPSFESIPAGTTINNNADNRVITGSNSANTLNAESNVIIDSSGRLLLGQTSGSSPLCVSGTNPVIAELHHSDGGTNDQARISLGALANNPPSNRGVNLIAENNGAGHDFVVACSASHSAGPGEKIRVKSSGGLTFNGDTAAANALDDYEEGTWTPDFNANITETNISSRYVKIGRSVTAQFYVNISGTFGNAAGASDTSLVISGLPYAAAANAFHTGVIDVGNGGAAGAFLRVSGGASNMSVLVGSGSVGTGRTHLRGNTIGAGDYVIGSITYQTA